VSDVEAVYLNSATVNLMATGSVAKTAYQLDNGAVTEGSSVTTNLYGAHILTFRSTDTSGNAEAVVTAPFFVDENVVPVVVSDAKASYAVSAAVEVTATDNFNGSGVDFLCYRVDGGKIVTAIAPARLLANKALLAKIATISSASMSGAPDITPTTTPPDGHYGPGCAGCHTIIIPTPEPTSTPEPTGTPTPSGGVSALVVVTGAGTHQIEYWAQDIARNASARVIRTFDIKAPHTLSYLAGAGGSIVGSATQTVDHNSTGTAVNATADSRYRFASWSDGRSTASRIDAGITGDRSITALFVRNNYLPVYRFYQMKQGSHFYTSNVAEKNNTVNNLSKTYRFEGMAYELNTSSTSAVAPLYRFYNMKKGVHFYTVSEAERDNVVAKYPTIYRYEGIAYNVSANSADTPVYRFYNKKNGTHFYTVDEGERQSVTKNLAATYTFEGVGYYLAK